MRILLFSKFAQCVPSKMQKKKTLGVRAEASNYSATDVCGGFCRDGVRPAQPIYGTSFNTFLGL
jgi:hypothetical protein